MKVLKYFIGFLLATIVHTALFLLFPALNVLLFETPERPQKNAEISYEIEIPVKPKSQKLEQKQIHSLTPSLNVESPSPSRPSAFQMDLSLATSAGGEGVAIGGGGGVQIYEASEVDQKASPLLQVAPEFPPRAEREGVQGRVKLMLVVEKNGAVSSIELLTEEPKGFGFAEASIEALSKFKYKPAKKEGIPVRQRYTKEFSFEY